MKKRTLLNLALAGIAALLAAAVLLSTPEEAAPAHVPVSGLEPDRVNQVSVERRDGVNMAFVREGGQWRMTRPAAAPVHGGRMQSLLSFARIASQARFDAAGLDLAPFGLGDPEVILRLDGAAFVFGGTEALDERRYVLFDGAVHLVEDGLYFQLLQNPGFFVDNRLLPAGLVPVRITYPDFVMFRDGERWRREPPAGDGGAAAQDIARRWLDARALTVRTPAGDFDPAGPRVTVEGERGEPVTFVVTGGAAAPVLARPDRDLAYHLDGHTAERLLLNSGGTTAAEGDG